MGPSGVKHPGRDQETTILYDAEARADWVAPEQVLIWFESLRSDSGMFLASPCLADSAPLDKAVFADRENSVLRSVTLSPSDSLYS